MTKISGENCEAPRVVKLCTYQREGVSDQVLQMEENQTLKTVYETACALGARVEVWRNADGVYLISGWLHSVDKPLDILQQANLCRIPCLFLREGMPHRNFASVRGRRSSIQVPVTVDSEQSSLENPHLLAKVPRECSGVLFHVENFTIHPIPPPGDVLWPLCLFPTVLEGFSSELALISSGTSTALPVAHVLE
ncbi:hypothetical protein TNIN_94511 [Trichonephila inaurata madagascariensis]|uniref:Uncharacterized protein n=1 Tax=Trichonephila inaurata madagascariensis TaxID=2747483 RepID=A0A8X6X5M2_9ARAC|nr:hypothetical protein TNIN_94511 [Trichonephila inaurata madagascariensis]